MMRPMGLMGRMRLKRPLRLAVLVCLAVLMALPGLAAIKETQIVTWNGSAWVRVAKGDIYTYASQGTAAATFAVGGGYGSTGCTIAATGNIQTNGTLTVDGATTLTGATTQTGEWQAGGGYASTGVTIATTGNTSIAGTLIVDGAATIPVLATKADTACTGYSAPAATIGAAEYGKTIFTSAAFTAKLPDTPAAAGTWLRIINCVNADLIVTTVSVVTGTIIADGSTAVKACTFGTSSHKIGACAYIISTGTAWVVVNQSSAAIVMTIGT